jgi:UDP-N-acetylmuramyl pentapeptide phosphotransferase/UDP-N-acetylglucosamine-1-phosphate transferase
MTVVLALAAGLAAATALLATTRAVLAQPALARENYRGHVLPTAGGVLLVAAVIAVDGGRTVLGLVGVGDAGTAPDRTLVLGAVVMFGFLGLVDDLLGDAGDRGLRGHVAAALKGRVTTGFVKLGGGAAVALVLAGAVDGDRPGRVLVDGALIALAANLGNLLDRAPGRTLKWGLACYLPIALAAGTAAVGVAVGVVAGAAVALLLADLDERLMLGDTGANALGAALGSATVLAVSPGARTIVAAVLLALTLLSELVSFSRIIDAVPPLRAMDRLGRRRPEAEGA